MPLRLWVRIGAGRCAGTVAHLHHIHICRHHQSACQRHPPIQGCAAHPYRYNCANHQLVWRAAQQRSELSPELAVWCREPRMLTQIAATPRAQRCAEHSGVLRCHARVVCVAAHTNTVCGCAHRTHIMWWRTTMVAARYACHATSAMPTPPLVLTHCISLVPDGGRSCTTHDGQCTESYAARQLCVCPLPNKHMAHHDSEACRATLTL